ncbi:hypothetical protein Kpol_208p3 [Vanderwaltozyma polyspora DSM 70294]|uniref:RING-type domain-containing protein n=1 Tax=Vanderwaltozyma polyspora (strain ATCC 22028 / DSM 70294 / BCRC 21397 / CBS 2163 / NBRC 10782 / NRRL Y-8283 / UCD 57-17) TaxID=436907 RepID=A7TTM3_VANPO|nr:uncharacterized protein Kpol_208p3 [Vanderwaltozyma polyspora DSM 70294]EDO14385.1 hypothetical protein Kpol_208p3 [Vanderwaltozyma polyspora DSM 70294]
MMKELSETGLSLYSKVIRTFKIDGYISQEILDDPSKILDYLSKGIKEMVLTEDGLPKLEFVAEVIGYIFSGYAIVVILTAIIINRLVAMSSLRSSTTPVSLPVFARVWVHLLVIIPLGYAIAQFLCQVEIIDYFHKVETSFFLIRVLIVLAWSHCIETFYCYTINKKPLTEFEYSLFEMSLQFYTVGILYSNDEYLSNLMFDSLMAMLSRLWVHIVEILDCKKHRIIGSSILVLVQVLFTIKCIKNVGLSSLSIFTIFRVIVPVLSILLISKNIILVFMTSLIKTLKSIMFIKGFYITSFNRVILDEVPDFKSKGTDEFSIFISKLALSLTETEKDTSNPEHTIQDNDKQEVIQHSYLISGYGNLLKSTPEDIFNIISENESQKKYQPKLPSFLLRLKIIQKLTMKILLGNTNIKNAIFFKSNKNSKKHQRVKQQKDFNLYVTTNNYAKFLARPDSTYDESVTLLPEEDSSNDYVLKENPNNSKYDKYEYMEDDDSLQDEIHDILMPIDQVKNETDISWHMSMWNILQYNLTSPDRLTRKSYSLMNESGLVLEVYVEKYEKHIHGLTANAKFEIEEDDDDEKLEKEYRSCLICKENKRCIVLWPCRCFVVCNECRTSLAERAIPTCISCKEEVYAYSVLHTV